MSRNTADYLYRELFTSLITFWIHLRRYLNLMLGKPVKVSLLGVALIHCCPTASFGNVYRWLSFHRNNINVSCAFSIEKLTNLPHCHLVIFNLGPTPQLCNLSLNAGPYTLREMPSDVVAFHIPGLWFYIKRNTPCYPLECGFQSSLPEL